MIYDGRSIISACGKGMRLYLSFMETQDHVPCRNCGEPISWDDWCWTHDDTGFADCGIVISGGYAPGRTDDGRSAMINPDIKTTRTDGATALPIGEWY